MKRSWAILACVAVLLCLGGCAPKMGRRRWFRYYCPNTGEAYIIEVTVGRTLRTPALDRKPTETE